MFCRRCGFQLPEDAIFCMRCGTPTLPSEWPTSPSAHSDLMPPAGQTLSALLAPTEQPPAQGQSGPIPPFSPPQPKPPAPRLTWRATPWGITLLVALALTVVASSVLTVLLVFLHHAPTAQHGPAIVEFTVQKEPHQITLGPDGNLWFTEGGNQLGRITPNGQITEFPPVPPAASAPYLPVALNRLTTGPDGNFWITDSGANQIVRFSPDGQVKEFPLPPYLQSLGQIPGAIAAGPDGNLWFSELGSRQIGRITPDGQITEFPLPAPALTPGGITAGPDGNMWFTESKTLEEQPQASKIGRISPNGTITEFMLPGPNSDSDDIAAGPDGNLWFTESRAARIGQISPQGVVHEFTILDDNDNPALEITAGPDGALWFTEEVGQLGRITTSGTVTEFPVPSMSGALVSPVAGPHNTIWFILNRDHKIGRLTLGQGSG